MTRLGSWWAPSIKGGERPHQTGLWRKEVIPGSRKEEKDIEEKGSHREGRGGKRRGRMGENNDCYSVLPKQGMPVSGVQRRARD